MVLRVAVWIWAFPDRRWGIARKVRRKIPTAVVVADCYGETQHTFVKHGCPSWVSGPSFPLAVYFTTMRSTADICISTSRALCSSVRLLMCITTITTIVALTAGVVCRGATLPPVLTVDAACHRQGNELHQPLHSRVTLRNQQDTAYAREVLLPSQLQNMRVSTRRLVSNDTLTVLRTMWDTRNGCMRHVSLESRKKKRSRNNGTL